jgi:hypothetical protein
MKTDSLSMIASLALTLMSGAVLSHWAGIDERIELASHAASTTPGQSFIQPMASQPWLTTEPPILSAATQKTNHPAASSGTVDPRILDLVERMQDQQEELRDQLAESNRDLMELQFRVDTHSESFRPLRATQEPTPSIPSATGVLPPIDTP